MQRGEGKGGGLIGYREVRVEEVEGLKEDRIRDQDYRLSMFQNA